MVVPAYPLVRKIWRVASRMASIVRVALGPMTAPGCRSCGSTAATDDFPLLFFRATTLPSRRALVLTQTPPNAWNVAGGDERLADLAHERPPVANLPHLSNELDDSVESMPFQPTPYLLVEKRGPVALVTLNNPEMLNAFLDDMHEGMEEVWGMLAVDGDVRAVVLTGAGKAFSAGGNI